MILQATQDYSSKIFLLQKECEKLYGQKVKVIEPYYFQQGVPQNNLILNFNEIIFCNEIGYTCVNEVTRSEFRIYYTNVDYYLYQAELAANPTRYIISDKITDRFVFSLLFISNTSFLYLSGYKVTFQENIF